MLSITSHDLEPSDTYIKKNTTKVVNFSQIVNQINSLDITSVLVNSERVQKVHCYHVYKIGIGYNKVLCK